MNYTLDSVKHAKECLEQQYKGQKVTYIPVVKTLKEIANNETKGLFYFGIVTCGNQDPATETHKIEFFDETETKIIEVLPDNQIIILFKNVVPTNVDEYGQFRGFELHVEGL